MIMRLSDARRHLPECGDTDGRLPSAGQGRGAGSPDPMGRFAASAEMCPALGFLASDEAAYVTGVVLPVDGGMSI
jgi:NAD(P)-dependent dehydrogenase (short-subunit alcohol dehydrogenase family)